MPSRKKSTGDNTNLEDSLCNFTCNLEEDDDKDGCIEIGGIVIPPPPLPSLTFDPTGPRLFINRIVIENFKSYGGTTVLGPFHKNFAAIIGPNGSGKSNVIDAMLFVFGYRAQKIRSKTVGVLIHNSDAFPNCNSCKVSVHFEKIIDQGKEQFEVVPNSEFVVSRIAFKDNSSYYTINDKRSMFKEVTNLLRSYGIDLDHNRFLILQGEVEQISLMKPISQNPHETGMLEFLEDIIGTGRLKEPIEKLQKGVDELNEKRSEKLNRVKSAQSDRDELEGQKNEALEFVKLKNEDALKRHMLTQTLIYQRNQKLENLSQKLKTLEENNAQFLNEYKILEKDISETSKITSKLSKTREEIDKRLQDNRAKYAQLELEDVSNCEDLKHSTDKIKRLKQNITKETSKLEELENAPEKLENDIEELQKEIMRKQEEKVHAETKLADVISSLKAETSEIQDEKEKHETRLYDQQIIVNDIKSKVDIAMAELDLYTKEEDKEKNKWESMRLNLETTEANILDKKNAVENLKLEIPNLMSSKDKNITIFEEVSVNEPKVTQRFQTLRAKLEDARNTLQNHTSRNRLVGALLTEKSEGRLPGLFGRLGDLGGIDMKYDIAISTACPQLESIITDTMDTAMQCVKFLKQNNLGLATFIALDKMDSWKPYVGKSIKTPRDVPRLFDLIKVNDKSLLPAFYFALRDTLVAKDIQEATAIGLQGSKRYRVVTLKGELVDVSGTMSGGGSRPIKGRMGASAVASEFTPQELSNMEKEVLQLQQERDDIVQRKFNLEETIKNQAQDLENKQHTLQRFEREIDQLEKHKTGLLPQIKEQEAKYMTAKTDPKRVAKLTTILEQNQKDFSDADKTATKLKATILDLHERIVEIGGSKMKAAKKLVSDANTQIEQANKSINQKKVAIAASKKNYEKAQNAIKKIEEEIKEADDTAAKLKIKIKGAELLGCQLTDEKDNIEKELSEVQHEMKGVFKNLKKLQASKTEMEGRRLDIKNELDSAKSDIINHEEEIEAWKEKLSRIKQIIVDGVEVQEFPTLNEDQLKTIDPVALNEIITSFDEELKRMKPNLGVIAQYKEKEQIYLERVDEFDAVTKDRDEMRKCYDELRKRRFDEFMSGFTIIGRKLKETYQMITLGGDADLELVNSLDPFSDGILFSVRPPRKSWKNISNLSGGEKTLSSLSLVFSLHYYKPTPFYIMDEIDAALDFRNVAIVAHYIKEQTKNAQFIVISLRENMFEQANRLIGVYKTYDTSHSVCLDIDRFNDKPSSGSSACTDT